VIAHRCFVRNAIVYHDISTQTANPEQLCEESMFTKAIGFK